MGALISEFITYIIKFIVMLGCAWLGVLAGKKIRKNKNEKLAAGNNEE